MSDITSEIHSTLMIDGEGLCKNFKDFWGRKKVAALTNVDISVREGRIFGLLGPNGAGKSTLIKLILGHLYPTRGRLLVLGKTPRDIETKQKIGYLPESSHLYKNLTALETLQYFGAILNLSKEQIKSRSSQLLEMVGLERAKKRMVGEYSHGMKRRLGLAQALLNDPSLLILDEPTAGLDPLGCREVKDLIITLGKRGKTVLLTSHLLADVEDVCDEIVLLFGGRIQARGKVQELLKNRTLTQLQFPFVSDQLLNNIMATLAKEIDASNIVITSPSESLESYFLRMVAKSTAQMQETYGAQMGKGVAEYLRDQDYQAQDPTAAINRDRLTSVDKSASDKTALEALSKKQDSEHSKTPEKATPDVDTNALTELTNDPSTSMNEDQSGAGDSIDKKLLDDLTRGSK